MTRTRHGQGGQIENQNRAWRWWFTRGIRLGNLDRTHVDHVTSIIDRQRRRNLDYHNPASLLRCSNRALILELAQLGPDQTSTPGSDQAVELTVR